MKTWQPILISLALSSCGGLSLSGGVSSSSSGTPSAGGSPGGMGGGNAQSAYDHFAVLGAKLGVPLEPAAGFTCGPPRGTDGFTTQNHSCVKFLDERCKGKPTKIHHIRSTGDVDRGPSCFMDEMNGATYLDREILLPPLSYLRLTGTDTPNAKVFEITYTFAGDDLTDDSKLGKALIAKYGPPTNRNPPVQMSWQQGEVFLRAECRMIAGDHAKQGDYCTITVAHPELDTRERERQAADDEAARRAGAPAPPAL